ncbi:MAG: pyridoxamine 5'-phosphate oxidase family protein [Duncaniella sp.]|nr:pyridoxamine 5'-phosphate oxidase family protein [Duncaniella sp.]
MRRSRQLLGDDRSRRILAEGKYAVWAVAGDDDYPYSVPVNYAVEGGYAYIHSAPAGHKIDAIRRNPRCSLCVVDRDEVVPEEFTSYFRSVIAFGEAEIVENDDEKLAALNLLCAKYSPGIDPRAEIDRFFNKVCIIRIRLDRVTGKEAIELVRKEQGS